jgi:flavin-dependent dehydrogenase
MTPFGDDEGAGIMGPDEYERYAANAKLMEAFLAEISQRAKADFETLVAADDVIFDDGDVEILVREDDAGR